MINQETLLAIKEKCHAFAASMAEEYDLQHLDIEAIRTNGHKFQLVFNGMAKVELPDREKLVHLLAQHGIPESVIDDTFEYAKTELKIVDVQIHAKPIIAANVNSPGDFYRFTVKQINKILETHLLNGMRA